MIGERQPIQCVVACRNAMGEPEFYCVTVECTVDQYENGDHYDAACAQAEDEGYEGWKGEISNAWVCDENDPAFAMIDSKEFFKKARLVRL
jgi:hypothetical protein